MPDTAALKKKTLKHIEFLFYKQPIIDFCNCEPNLIYRFLYNAQKHKEMPRGRDTPGFGSNQSLTANEVTAGEQIQKVVFTDARCVSVLI